MLDKTALQFSHVRPGETDYRGEGLRDFFLYRDLGVAEATAGKVLAQQHEGFWAPMDTLKDQQWLESLHESGDAPWQVWDPARNARRELEYAASG